MILSYTDIVSGQRRTVEATITTDHALSSYGQPVILVDGEPIDGLSWTLLDYRVEQASEDELRLLGGAQ